MKARSRHSLFPVIALALGLTLASAPALTWAGKGPLAGEASSHQGSRLAAQVSEKATPEAGNTIICYYGNRAASTLGLLGEYSLPQLEASLQEQTSAFTEVNGGRPAVPCFDYIYMVANPSHHPYSHYTPRMDLFEEALDYAERHGILFFIDLQLGYRDIREEIVQILPYLDRPNVHIAIDTEFYMVRKGGIPGDTLGSMDAEDINLIKELMEQYIQHHRLPGRILKVYQFDPSMLTNKHLLQTGSGSVRVLINGDGVGFGGVEGKIEDYTGYATEPYDLLGMKLFLQWDSRLLRPEELMALTPPPDEVVYQ